MVRMDLQRIKPKIKSRTNHPKSKEENVYTVVVMANAAAVRNRLDAKMYELRVKEDSLSLHSISNKKQVVSWPYFYIRRYGPDVDKFHLQAGRRCQTGEGLFSLKCYPGEAETIHSSLKQIFNRIQAQKLSESASSERHAPASSYTSVTPRKMSNYTEITPRGMSQNGTSAQCSFLSNTAFESSDEEENSPDLPPRKYRTDTKSFKDMLGRIHETKQETKHETEISTKPPKKVHFNIQPQSAHKSKSRSPDPKPLIKQRQFTPTEINDMIRQHRDGTLTQSAVDKCNNNEENYSVLDEIRHKKHDSINHYDEVIYEE